MKFRNYFPSSHNDKFLLGVQKNEIFFTQSTKNDRDLQVLLNKVNIFLIVSVKLNACLLTLAVAQNKEHLLEMLKCQSESALYNLIKFYTVKIQNMQKQYAKYIQICKNVAKYVKIYKNAKNNMQIFKFFQADNRFQRSQFQIKPICYFMSYMQKCKNPKSINDAERVALPVKFKINQSQ